jgi:hypothetical protein
MTPPIVDLSFPHRWAAEILASRPLILPPRHFIYPREAEEVERGALEVLVRPNIPGAPEPALSLSKGLDSETWDRKTRISGSSLSNPQPFLATCALGFRDPAVPTGLWSAPKPEEICAVSGGYAYLIDTTAPERFTMIEYRPVLDVRVVVEAGLILFVGHRAILAWGRNGQAWRSDKLSDEGVKITAIHDPVLRGLGWEIMTDKETPFALDLQTGRTL